MAQQDARRKEEGRWYVLGRKQTVVGQAKTRATPNLRQRLREHNRHSLAQQAEQGS